MPTYRPNSYGAGQCLPRSGRCPMTTAQEGTAARKPRQRPATVTRLPGVTDGPGLPDGVDRHDWVQAGAVGTDGRATYKLNRDGDGWVLLIDAHVRFLAERIAATDPDFPDRDEEGD